MIATVQDDSQWHNWFAWFPVYIHTFFVWNDTVQRRRVWVDIPQDCMYGNTHKWEYKLPRDKQK